MRICLVSQEYPPETAHGGIGTQTYLKAHGLAARGHALTVLSRSVDAQRHDYADGPVRVLRIPGAEQQLPLYTEPADWVTYSTAVAVELAALQAAAPFDLLDFPEWGCEGYLHLLNRSEWNHVPAVIQIHGPLVMFAHTVDWPPIDSEFYRTGTAMEAACLRQADAIYSSSACSADWCARNYGLDREAIPVIHTGVDTRLFAVRDVPKPARPTIVFMGRITGDKGVPTLAEAALRLVDEFPDLHLRLLGRGDDDLMVGLRRRAAERGAGDLLDFAGFVRREELPEHLNRAHVFAAPSLHEPGPGLVNLEAMACGLPVVATAGAGAAEVVRDGENGLLVAPGDPAALAAALRRLLTDPAEREAMGRRARASAVEQADSEACLDRIEAFYAGVVATTPRPA